MDKMNENNIERLLQMHDNLEQFDDDELQNVLDSDDMAADLDTLSAVKRALATEQAGIDDDEISRQWAAFEAKHFTQEKPETTIIGRSWLKIAAMFVGVVMIVGMAFAAVHIINSQRQSTATQTEAAAMMKDETLKSQLDATELADTTAATSTEETDIVEFDDVELSDILNAMAAYYHIELQYENKQSKHIKLFFKWNKQADVASIVELLNSYDRINMELSGETLIIK